MTNPFNSSRNFNALLFENKNKAYGAYALREAQSNTVAKSMGITFIGISVLVLTAFVSNKNKMEKNTIIPIDSVFVTEWNLTPPEIEKPLVVDPPKEPVKSPYSDDPNYEADDHQVIDPPKANVDLVLNPGGTKDGDIDSTKYEPVVPHVDPPLPPAPPEPPAFIAQVMPEFKGMAKFIADNLNYPPVAVENGTTGTVFLSFVVEKDGSVNDVKVLKGLPDGCAEEAMRVVKMMPKWKPGQNHGEPVRVQFNLPIKFNLK